MAIFHSEVELPEIISDYLRLCLLFRMLIKVQSVWPCTFCAPHSEIAVSHRQLMQFQSFVELDRIQFSQYMYIYIYMYIYYICYIWICYIYIYVYMLYLDMLYIYICYIHIYIHIYIYICVCIRPVEGVWLQEIKPEEQEQESSHGRAGRGEHSGTWHFPHFAMCVF